MRTPARVLGLALSFVVMFAAGTGAALADQPIGDAWPDGEGRSTLDTLLLFGGATVGLYILISLFGLLTARRNYVPPAPGSEIATAGDKAPAKH